MAPTPDQTRLSVVIPVYRSARYIEPSLRAILRQVRPVDEVVLVDDRGDDGSIAVATYILTSAGVDHRVVELDRNRGAGYARNAGVRAATGDVIWFFDSDDLADPTFTARMLDALVREHADFASCRTMFVDPAGAALGVAERRMRRRFVDGHEFARMLMRGRVKAYPPARLFRRAVLGDAPWDERRAYEDMAATLRIALRADRVALVDEPLLWYRQHPESTSQVTCTHTADVFTMGDEVARLAPELRERDAFWGSSRWGSSRNRSLARAFRYREVLIPAAHMAMRAAQAGTGDPDVVRSLIAESRRRSSLGDVVPLVATGQLRSAAFAVGMAASPSAYARVLSRR
ncbi:glycosyltransferase family 2 protein [Gordonia sputi]|nr:glycosyltransferase family 2 protein [Gordonia sputi]